MRAAGPRGQLRDAGTGASCDAGRGACGLSVKDPGVPPALGCQRRSGSAHLARAFRTTSKRRGPGEASVPRQRTQAGATENMQGQGPGTARQLQRGVRQGPQHATQLLARHRRRWSATADDMHRCWLSPAARPPTAAALCCGDGWKARCSHSRPSSAQQAHRGGGGSASTPGSAGRLLQSCGMVVVVSTGHRALRVGCRLSDAGPGCPAACHRNC